MRSVCTQIKSPDYNSPLSRPIISFVLVVRNRIQTAYSMQHPNVLYTWFSWSWTPPMASCWSFPHNGWMEGCEVWGLWSCEVCGVVRPVELWGLWSCEVCGVVRSVELWGLWSCEVCGVVRSVELYVRVVCSPRCLSKLWIWNLCQIWAHVYRCICCMLAKIHLKPTLIWSVTYVPLRLSSAFLIATIQIRGHSTSMLHTVECRRNEVNNV